MKRTESEEERNNFQTAVKSRHNILPIWLTLSLSSTHTSSMNTKSRFQVATDMSRAETVLSTLYLHVSKLNDHRCQPFTKQVILGVATNSDSEICVFNS